MGRPRTKAVVVNGEYQDLSRQAINAVHAAKTLTGLHVVGRLIEKMVYQQRRHTTALGVTQDLAEQIRKDARRGNLGCSFSQLNRMYQFARDWTDQEVRQLEGSGVPWRLMIQLLPYKQRAKRLKASNEPRDADSVDKEIKALLKQLSQKITPPAHVQVEAWVKDQRYLLVQSKPRVTALLADSALLRLAKVELFLNKVCRRDPAAIDDWQQTQQSVRHLRKVLGQVERRLGR